MRHYLRLFSIPLGFLLVTFSLRLLWLVFHLPPADVFALQIGGWLHEYGLPIVFLSAIAEGMLLVGGYFPGIFIISISVILARSPYEAFIAVVVGSAGLMVAHVANYLLGRYGWYRLLVAFGLSHSVATAKDRLERRGPMAIFLSYWMPSLASLTDTAAGIIAMPFRRFLLFSVAGVIFWDSLVGLFLYYLGDKAFALISPNGTDIWIVALVVVLWMVGLLVIDLRKQSRRSDL